VSEFDEKAAQAAGMNRHNECTSLVDCNPDPVAMFREGARWQHSQLQSQLAARDALIGKIADALDELVEHTSTHLEDMQHYFDNKCCPTVDEVNACAVADSNLRLLIGQIAKARGQG
jgi:hypothetical protein